MTVPVWLKSAVYGPGESDSAPPGGPPSLRPQVRIESVAHDCEKPALEVGAWLELRLLVECGEDGVLHQIVGSVPCSSANPPSTPLTQPTAPSATRATTGCKR